MNAGAQEHFNQIKLKNLKNIRTLLSILRSVFAKYTFKYICLGLEKVAAAKDKCAIANVDQMVAFALFSRNWLYINKQRFLPQSAYEANESMNENHKILFISHILSAFANKKLCPKQIDHQQIEFVSNFLPFCCAKFGLIVIYFLENTIQLMAINFVLKSIVHCDLRKCTLYE